MGKVRRAFQYPIKEEYKFIDGLTLKIIAILSMLTDHTGRLLFPGKTILILLGRLAFVIFAFLTAEGFEKTSNLRKYQLRMLVFALISEIPFDLAFTGKPFNCQVQNVYFELFLGLVTLELMYGGKERKTFTKLLIMLASCFIATLGGFDYTFFGIMLIVLFYEHKNELVPQVIGGPGLSLLFSRLEKYGFLALIPITMYNGKQMNSGKKLSRAVKLGFYLFYPFHILVLYCIKSFCR